MMANGPAIRNVKDDIAITTQNTALPALLLGHHHEN